MKFITIIFFVLFQAFVAVANESSRIEIRPEAQGSYQAGEIEYGFKLFDTELNKEVVDVELVDSHTKKLHFVIYDSALKEFAHVHPEFNGSIWKVNLNLAVNGNYFAWAQGVLGDNTEFLSLIRAQIKGGKPANIPASMGDIRKGADQKTMLELSKTKIKAGKTTMLNFKVTRTDGQTPVMSPYLGALAHVIATPTTGDELIHVHPMDGSEPNSGMLHATFPKEGEYRLWVQFIEHDELKTIPLSVVVLK